MLISGVSGHLKFLVQSNATHTGIQELGIALCVLSGSLCSACHEGGDQASKRVCSQTYEEHRLMAKGNYGKDITWDLFMFPDGCACFSVS